MRLLLLPFLFSTVGILSSAESFPPEQIAFFETEIRPVLVDNCLKCHTGAKARVGLQLDHRDGWLKGSDYRKVINPHNAAESVILHAVRQNGKEKTPKMPEKGDKLNPEAIEALQKWIAMGLPWPINEKRDESTDPRKHWSFQPVNPPELPENAGHPIDYFIRTKLEEKGIAPAPRAGRYDLHRRLSFDLVGLPPTFEETEEFINNPEPHQKIWPALIDKFLASPQYGERWARHWMDIARYSDTKGYEAGGRERKFIFSHTYRDWLIRSFNEDLPFDQFLLYQLAAEQLVDWKGADREHLAALGFISLSKNGKQELVIDDRIDTTFRGMMGLTVSCARCHDHKFDPVSTKEYYSLYGIFRNSLATDQPLIAEPPNTPEYKAYLGEIAKLEKKRTDYLTPLLARVLKENPKLKGNEAGLISKLPREEQKKARELQEDVKKFIAKKEMEPDKALIVKDHGKPSAQHVYIRGNPSRRGELVKASFPKLGSPSEPEPFKQGSGRLEMAKEIASAKNPLTARVIVNRVWMWHFGEGIVRTVSDFGLQGEHPSHPELLDWLAGWFVQNGWSVKKLHRLILTSETWQQSSSHPEVETTFPLDPENRLLWRSFRHRLDFEQMRDAMLAASGELDTTLYGRSVKILEPPYSRRRSVYAFIDRQNLSSVFRHFDFSNPQESTGQRPDTTIPMQALFTMNSDFAMKRAENLIATSGTNEDLITALHRKVFAKEPSEKDKILADSFLKSFHSGDKSARQNLSGWSYGWGGVDKQSGEVSFHLYQHWDAKKNDWRINKEYPVPDSPKRYLHTGNSSMHPGLGEEYSNIFRWHSPKEMKIDISGEVTRPAVGKGRSGMVMHIVSSKNGILLTKKLPVNEKTIPVELGGIDVAPDEIISFVTDCDGDTSFDTYSWDPTVSNAGNPEERWKYSVDFSGPVTPLDAPAAYAHALLNTNRFLFIQ
ncbi:MAG: PSD1 and planctomycete cytochrome C domain-containing protein [Verrucomicrobiales bacterium]|nr:PSD1 and planctomycete cytochrome C domain-containing protein [Verrucomicrobiales bacterium]